MTLKKLMEHIYEFYCTPNVPISECRDDLIDLIEYITELLDALEESQGD